MRNTAVFFLIFSYLSTVGQVSYDLDSPVASTKTPELYTENGRMGIQKNTGKPVTPAVYDTLYRINDNQFAGKRFSSSKQQSLWGIVNNDGKSSIPFQYIELEISNTLALVGLQKQNLIYYGAYNLDGNEIIPVNYESISPLNDQLIYCTQHSIASIFSISGNPMVTLEADSLEMMGNGHIKFFDKGKAGIYYLKNHYLEEAKYSDIKLENNEIWVQKFPEWTITRGYDSLFLYYDCIRGWENNFIVGNRSKYWLIDSNNKGLSKVYDSIRMTNPQFSIVKKQGRWGAINAYGEEIISTRYDQIISDDEVIYAKSHNKWVLYDYYGYLKTKLKYDSVKTMTEGRIAINRKNKWGFANRFGIEVIAPIFDKVGQFRNGKAIVTLYGEDGIIDVRGKWIAIPCPIHIIDVNHEILLGKVNNQYQVRKFDGELIYFTGNKLQLYENGFTEIDSAGIEVRKISKEGTFQYETVEDENTLTGGAGLLIFKENNKYGFKDQLQRIIIANQYEAVKPFHERLAAVRLNNKWGFINLDERIIVQPNYDSVGNFSNGYCITKKGGQLGVIDKKGKEIIPNRYQEIILDYGTAFRVRNDGNWGVLNLNGAVIIHPKYSELTPVGQQFYIIKRRGKYGTMDMKGVNKIPLMYDYIEYNERTKTYISMLSYHKEWTFLRKVNSVN
ncbi:MAG: WG repeat-containing protein [Bacteroidota bacterium]